MILKKSLPNNKSWYGSSY